MITPKNIMCKISTFFLFLFAFMESVSCGVYTIIRGQKYGPEQDVFKFDFGCYENNLAECCRSRDAYSFATHISGSCQCGSAKATFLLHLGTCVKNELMRSSNFMDFGGEDCKHFIGNRNKNRPLATLDPATSYEIKSSTNDDYDICKITSVLYLDAWGTWRNFSTDYGRRVFKMDGNDLKVSSTVTSYKRIVGGIVKLALKDCPKGNDGCLLFKVAGTWTYDNSTSSTPSSTMIQTVTPTTEEASLVPSKTPQYTSHKAGTKATTVHSTPQLSLVPSVLQLSSSSEGSFVTDVPSKTKAVAVQTLQSMEHSTIATSSGVGVISSVNSVTRMTPTKHIPNTLNPKHSQQSGGGVGAAVGGGVAAVALLIIFVLATVCIVRKRKKNRTERPQKFQVASSNPAYEKGSSFALEKSHGASTTDNDYITPVDGRVNKPYKSLIKKQPVNVGSSDEEYTYATGDSLPQEPHYQGLVRGKSSDTQGDRSTKGDTQEPLYNVLEDPNSIIVDSGKAPVYDVLEDSNRRPHDHNSSNSQNPSRRRYTKPPKSTKATAPGVDTASVSTPMYDVLEGPNSDNDVSSSRALKAPLYDVLEGPSPETNVNSEISKAPLYDVLEGPQPSPVTSPNRGSTQPTGGVSDQTYEALQPTRESIYQPLDQGFDDYDNTYQSVGGSSA